MNKFLLTLFFSATTLFGGNLIFPQEQIINKSTLSNDIFKQKIAFLDSLHKADNFKLRKQQQDNIYYKSLTEQGYTRWQSDNLHKIADPNFLPPADETGVHTKFQNHSSNNAKNN